MKHSTAMIAIILGCTICAAGADFKELKRFSIPGADGWDYVTVDSSARRIYVSHGVRVNVLDADTGAPIGTIEDTPGVHGIAIASAQHHGFTSNGKEDRVTMFDLSTLAVIKKIEVGKGPDGIYYDAASERVFTNNHHSHNISAINAATGEVVGTVLVGGDGEGAVFGKDGLVYVALEDKSEIAVFDPKTLEVKRHFPLDGVTGPTGLAIDSNTNRLFVGGHNKTMLVMDAETGKKIASFPTGAGTDAAGFDSKTQRIFFSNGEGNLTVIQEKSADEYVQLTSVATQQSAKTMALDEKTGTIYLPAATVVSTPAADPAQKPKRTITDGTFCILVVEE